LIFLSDDLSPNFFSKLHLAPIEFFFLSNFYSILLALMIIPRPQLLSFGDILLHLGIFSSNLWLAAFIFDFS
jgi:hypothetical protein